MKSPWDEKTRIVRNEEKKNELALTKDGKKDFFFLAKSPTIYLCISTVAKTDATDIATNLKPAFSYSLLKGHQVALSIFFVSFHVFKIFVKLV